MGKSYKDGCNMGFKDYTFQTDAVNKMINAYTLNKAGVEKNNNIILQSPTGSGKTAMLVRFMDRIVQDYPDDNVAFVWLTPGAGKLEQQSWSKTSQNAQAVGPYYLLDALSDGFKANSVTFLNWELVNNRKNIALRDGERTNLPSAIKSAHERGLHFVLIIDEEHRNQTSKAQTIIDMFDADIIYRASATPIEDNSAKYIIVTEEDVITEELITKSVVLNDQFNGGGTEAELHAGDEDFLDAADRKRRQLKSAFHDLGKSINPLVLIQFPDEKKSDNEVASKVEEVREYLTDELGQKESEIATWLSDIHSNVQDISKNDSQINYLLMKQAVSTGWDAPRAKILVKLRLNTSHNFTIQTIGRIRRMPERHYYTNDILNNAYVYSNDSKYVSEIIKSGMGTGITQMSLQKGVGPNEFNISSIKMKIPKFKNAAKVTENLHKEFTKEFHLTNDVDHNEAQFKKYGWKFGRYIYTTVKSGQVTNIEDIATKTQDISAPTPITDTRPWGYRYDSVMDLIKQYLHIGNDLPRIRAVINDLFGIGDSGSGVEPLLQLSPKDRYGFVINNAILLRDVVKNMDAHYSSDFYEQLHIDESLVDKIPFKLPVREGYHDTGDTGTVLSKNVYTGYSTSNWVKQSRPERMIEEQLNNSDNVKWFYRSKDHGSKYFSIVYDRETRDFYPDYLVKGMDGKTYILETKGAQGQNIDDYASQKYQALKNYVENHCDSNVKFAFVRPSLKHKGVLLYNNSKWDKNVDDSEHWHPLEELFNQN